MACESNTTHERLSSCPLASPINQLRLRSSKSYYNCHRQQGKTIRSIHTIKSRCKSRSSGSLKRSSKNSNAINHVQVKLDIQPQEGEANIFPSLVLIQQALRGALIQEDPQTQYKPLWLLRVRAGQSLEQDPLYQKIELCAKL